MKQIKFLVFAWLSCLAVLSHAEPQLGREYGLVAHPQPTDGKKIEVTEVFSYSCPHCFDLEPTIAQWAKKLPKDVSFVRLHAVSNPAWVSLGKLFYALESLGELERLHADAFNAFHIKDVKLTDEKTCHRNGWPNKASMPRNLPMPTPASACKAKWRAPSN